MTHNHIMIGDSEFVQGLKKKALIIGAVGLVGSLAVGVISGHMLLPSYLLAFTYFMGISVTAVFFSALQFLVRAGWSASIRRIAEFMGGFVPYIFIGFIPFLLDVWGVFGGHSVLYHWAGHHAAEADKILQAKSPYLNQIFFSIRLALYCLVWIWMRKFIVGNSYKQDELAEDYTPTKKNMKRAAPFILLYALTITFAGFDLLMSVEPHWFSTMFGVYFFAGNFVSTIAMLTIFTVFLHRGGYLKGYVTNEHFHDLGKLLFAFTVFWTYINFSQYFLIWYSNMPEETDFFIRRTQYGWEIFGWALLFVHFILPFCILLQQKAKRNQTVLLVVSFILLFMHLIDLSWIVLPVFGHNIFFAWQVIPLFMLILGIFLFVTAQQFGKKSVVAVNDPLIEESIELVS
jgi:hypothetical protein